MAEHTRQSVLFESAFSKRLSVTFDGEQQSSDGGLVLLGAVDRRLGLTRELAACLVDERDASRIEHTYEELLRQRVFAIAAGYPDANDAGRTRDDPVLKEVVGRRGLTGAPLGSQPTLSRFERAATGRELVRMERALLKRVVERHRRRLGGRTKLITIDLDPAEDRAHGQQPFSFFNGHYESNCYLPVFGFLSFDDEPDQYLCWTRLRPGNSRCPRVSAAFLRRCVDLLRHEFPRARLRVRLDGGFAAPQLFSLLEELRVEYVVAMPGNKRLTALAEPWLAEARNASAKSNETAQVFGEFRYAAESWPFERRIVVKAEVTRIAGREPRDNPRFVVTNLRTGPERTYDVYRGRGEPENRLKELLNGLAIDRTSSTSYLANQFRVLMTAAAYVLIQELRRAASRTSFARAQVQTIRERLFKIGARVTESVRRIVCHFPASYPWSEPWMRIARAVGAT